MDTLQARLVARERDWKYITMWETPNTIAKTPINQATVSSPDAGRLAITIPKTIDTTPASAVNTARQTTRTCWEFHLFQERERFCSLPA